MTPLYILRVVGEGCVARRPSADNSGKQESADYCSKKNSGNGRAVSLQRSLSIQTDMGMRNLTLY